jgi:hypothetical protein
MCFDRASWSRDLFAEIINAGFGLLTYRKTEAGKDLPHVAGDAFTTMTWIEDDSPDRRYGLADGTIDLPSHRVGTRARYSLCGRSPAETRANRCTSSPPVADNSCPPPGLSTG